MKVIPIRHENTVKHDLTVIVASFVIFILVNYFPYQVHRFLCRNRKEKMDSV